MRRPGKSMPPRHERAKKRQTPVGDRQYIKPPVYFMAGVPGGTGLPVGEAFGPPANRMIFKIEG
ncbi:Uncharacterised protein [Rikenella microfusus]|uniref:Uncharacterized protein n=1 Tax=Rikenella microfusus TaxID=28139 RepID=A0A379MPR9_9BACT|nr:Uncharacterised protein [Rikenella microfusus]